MAPSKSTLQQHCLTYDEYLREGELRADDWETIYTYCSHPSVRRDILPRSSTVEGTRDLVRIAAAHSAKNPRTYFALGIVLASEDRLIGTCCLDNVTPYGVASIGWDLNHNYWGRGYMAEAARAMTEFAFKRCGVLWICADCFMGNKASVRVMEKIGMRRHDLPLLDEVRMACHYRVFHRIVRHCISIANWEIMERSRSQSNRT